MILTDDPPILEKILLATGSPPTFSYYFTASGYQINSIGYRRQDNYIYGMSGNNIVRLDSGGGITIIGNPGIPGSSFCT